MRRSSSHAPIAISILEYTTTPRATSCRFCPTSFSACARMCHSTAIASEIASSAKSACRSLSVKTWLLGARAGLGTAQVRNPWHHCRLHRIGPHDRHFGQCVVQDIVPSRRLLIGTRRRYTRPFHAHVRASIPADGLVEVIDASTTRMPRQSCRSTEIFSERHSRGAVLRSGSTGWSLSARP